MREKMKSGLDKSLYEAGDRYKSSDGAILEIISVDFTNSMPTALIQNVGQVNKVCYSGKYSFEQLNTLTFNWEKIQLNTTTFNWEKVPSKKDSKYVVLCDDELILETWLTKEELVEYLTQSYEGLYNDGCPLPASLEEDCFRVYELVPVKHTLKATFQVELED